MLEFEQYWVSLRYKGNWIITASRAESSMPPKAECVLREEYFNLLLLDSSKQEDRQTTATLLGSDSAYY